MLKDAVLSDCRTYRYALWRIWDDTKPYAMFIGLNPSTADEINDDPTLTRCIGFARSWGYGGVCMANLFALRSTDPATLKSVDDPVGAENDQWLKKLAEEAGIIVAAWGNKGSYLGRDQVVREAIDNLHYLRITYAGQPSHPLYLPGNLKPIPIKR